MNNTYLNKKLYPSLMILGAGILLYRTIKLMFFEDGLQTLALWVNALTIFEMLIDLACIAYSVKWLLNNKRKDINLSLKLGASAAIFHAFRVLIFAIGRLGPWVNFDVKPQYRETVNIDVFWVYFAGILSVLGIIGVIVIWLLRRRKLKNA